MKPDLVKAERLLKEGSEKLKDAALALSELAEWLERVAKEFKG